MAGSVNKAILIGRFDADPEIRRMQSGEAVANFQLATIERWPDKATGEKEECTEWQRVVEFGKLVGVVESYVRKGQLLYIEGAIQTCSRRHERDQDRSRPSSCG